MTEPTTDGGPDLTRKIIHVDMDAFFASVEQRDDPALRGKPVAVGGSRERGVVVAASYEARRYGVRSAMASVTARRKCPDLLFVRPRFDVYKSVSDQIHTIFRRHTDRIEPLSLDEAYLDVTGVPSARDVAEAIRAAIHAETGLTASAGVSYNKFLAKVASDQNKPDGICVIPPSAGPRFAAALPIGRFHGIGPVTAAKMTEHGILTGADLLTRPADWLRTRFGKAADYYLRAAAGLDDRPVRFNRIRKSIGAERTFSADISNDDGLFAALDPVLDAVWERIARSDAAGRTVTLKVKYQDFHQITRARSSLHPVATRPVLDDIARGLLRDLLPVPKGVRLLGVTLSALCEREPVGVTGLLL
ncbi:DNA polymerase IV [Sphingomonas prati]|uniref:DNA polymerase IV n=1 Tax=Sphingomonas prati TaxID=1843237 RepID=A0A7W9BSH5_9SPHN|nr:DNA polymerase IV [Sphingomonas prati]MBB5729282.1 DNA polymerase-4 [Sphingomonas prati]